MTYDDSEIYVSDDGSEGGSENEETWDPEDPTFFQLGLTPEGQPAKYNVSRSRGQKPRAVASWTESGSKVRPAFQVSSAAKLIVHGTMDEEGGERATLLVHEFTFLAHGSTRIKKGRIELEFKSLSGRPDGPLVQRVAPFGGHEMLAASRGAQRAGADARLHQVGGGARVVGERPADEYGHSVKAEWSIDENLDDGIPWRLRTCVLLKRVSDDDFCLRPTIKALPNLAKAEGFLSTRSVDHPIVFDPGYEPFDELEGSLEIDRWNLGSLDLSGIWGWDYPKA